MERKGMYIYGILNLSTNIHFSIPQDLVLEESETRPGAQERDKSNGVYTIAYQDISALVRDSGIVEYSGMRKDTLARLLVGHQTVIERVMTAQTTVIPMRFGTFAQNETEVRDILRKGYNLIKEIFERISNKIEIDITATWGDLASIIKEVGEEKDIKEFKEKLLSNPKGINADDQMKIGFMLKNELDKKRDNYACQIQEALKTMSPDFKAHELMDDKMVVNIAFLIDKTQQDEFDKKVEELNAIFNEKLNFRCVGPLPPYSFYTLEIKTVKSEEVDWAKKKLGILNDITSKDEIKRAYQRKTFSTHPDKNPNNPYAEKEFDEVNQAYKILSEYRVALDQANQQGNAAFERKMFSPLQRDPAANKDNEAGKENAMLVRVRE